MGGNVPLSRDDVLDALHKVIDPELGYNIVDIGLIYNLEVHEGIIRVIMTMTTPGCPAQEYILMGVEDCCRRIAGVTDANVSLTWDPPWSPAKMSPAAKAYFRISEDSNA